MSIHFFGVEKEENGIIFASCLSHNPSEYAVGIRKDDKDLELLSQH